MLAKLLKGSAAAYPGGVFGTAVLETEPLVGDAVMVLDTVAPLLSSD
jgi:hypothetical protein